jgi:glycosyltransferase involved in cell wall biosynthesis
LGGAEVYPQTFWRDFSFKNKVYETLRSLARWLGEQDPFTRLTAQRSAIAYAVTQDTAKRISNMGAKSVKIFSAIALADLEIEQFSQCPSVDTSPVRFISIARLLHWKGIHLGLRAFALANLLDAEYWIVGEGEEMKRLQSLASDLGIGDQVKFLGLLHREEVILKLGQCSVLVHPSLHDSGGGVCLEAMAAGRPVICLDLGGPAEQITPETGFKVSAKNPEESIKAMAKVMVELGQNPKFCNQMGQSGQQRVKELYSWQAKGKQLSQAYQQIVKRYKCTF